MKKTFLVFISSIAYFISIAQTEMIKEVFRLLPADKIYDLSLATRDSMLEGKTYYPDDNDSDQIAAYNYGISALLMSALVGLPKKTIGANTEPFAV